MNSVAVEMVYAVLKNVYDLVGIQVIRQKITESAPHPLRSDYAFDHMISRITRLHVNLTRLETDRIRRRRRGSVH